MGSNFSSANNVAVWCDKPVYFSGDLVQGYVLLNVTVPFAGRSVVAEVDGYERTSWVQVTHHSHTDSSGQTTTSTTRSPRRDKNTFFAVAVPLWNFNPNQAVAPGQYQFGFRFVLPVEIPSTYCFHGSGFHQENVSGKVKYKVTGVVHTAEQKHLRSSTLKGKLEIVVHRRLMRTPAEITDEVTTPVKCCCLSGRGDVTVRLRAEEDAYAARETAHILLEINNSTQLGFPKLRCYMERLVYLQASGSSFRSSVNLFDYTLPGVPNGVSYLGANALRLDIPLQPNLSPTTTTRLITCTYRVWVELSAGLCTNNPRVCVGLNIHAPAPQYGSPSAAPPDYWRPQMVTPAVEVVLAGAAPMPAPPPNDGKPSETALSNPV